MATFIDKELTEDLRHRLNGRFGNAQPDQVILIHTVDPDGYPHPAILSYFEVVATDRQNIRLATYKESRSAENMRRNGKTTLSIFDERVTYYLKGRARELRREMRSAVHNSMMNVALEQVLTDQTDPLFEPGAYIESGITAVNPNIQIERTRYDAILTELVEVAP